MPSFSPTSSKAYVELRVGKKFKGILVSHMLLIPRPDPKEKQVINLDQDVHVYGYFWDGVRTPFYEPSLSFSFFFGHGLSFFLFIFLFMLC
jgi:ribulose kinase